MKNALAIDIQIDRIKKYTELRDAPGSAYPEVRDALNMLIEYNRAELRNLLLEEKAS